MGCGGSRADAIEPRYYESWTRETESTWLTNTDAEPPQQPLPAAGPESWRRLNLLHSSHCLPKESPGSAAWVAMEARNLGFPLWDAAF
uniref:BAALC binder of MAP3K1 and KLF4 n=1 Tax=Pseudonaja textilis TaxID=8673 RepID=A0A670XQ68_PSETE